MSTAVTANNYRSYLREVLVERMAKNPAYSLRAFARDLDLTPSHVSGLFKGTKNLSLANAHRVTGLLELDENTTETFCLLVQYEHAKSPELKDSFRQKLQARSPQAGVRELSVDLFKSISDWYHIPILVLADLPEPALSATSAATHLGITELEASVAIERLERLELLQRDEDGRYRRVHENSLFHSDLPNAALRKFHTQMLHKAAASIERQAPEQRVIGSRTFAIDPARLPKARELTNRYYQQMVELFDQGEAAARSEVYHLEVVLFDLKKTMENRK